MDEVKGLLKTDKTTAKPRPPIKTK